MLHPVRVPPASGPLPPRMFPQGNTLGIHDTTPAPDDDGWTNVLEAIASIESKGTNLS